MNLPILQISEKGWDSLTGAEALSREAQVPERPVGLSLLLRALPGAIHYEPPPPPPGS